MRPKLYVDQAIEINAPASTVWDVLTQPEYTDQWLRLFSGGAELHLKSDWQPGSPVLWQDGDGSVIVEGNVTALEQNKLLRFTVFDVRSAERPPVTEEDGITFRLSEENARTKLHLLQGDFSTLAEGKIYRDRSAEAWERVLPKVKELAESAS